ncbi:aminodeoxychorismate synthase component I [Subtercola sp. YIM 133946]|uniref:aminodeoxychorismate synthase component I n=1 Tax=Subtercola sp. YIM 133946 TaxID=3118909 RepID=UPI002F930442
MSLGGLTQTARLPRHVEILDFWVDPAVAFDVLAGGARDAFWLDGGVDATSGWSHLGTPGPLGAVALCDPVGGGMTVRASNGGAASGADAVSLDCTAFELLAATESHVRPRAAADPAASAAAASAGSAAADAAAAGRPATRAGFDLGWVGWLGYENGARELGVVHAAEQASDTVLLFADRVLSFDHARRQLRLVTLVTPGSDAHLDWCETTALQLRLLVGRAPVAAPAAPQLADAHARHSPDEYRALIAACQREIAAGNAYQLCLTNRFEAQTSEDARTVYRRLRVANPTAHGGLVMAGDTALLSSSPEVFLTVGPDRRVQTRPIKGTRPRGATAAADEALRRELHDDVKERAENVMIVDLMRNDLSRVSELGSVEVTGLFEVEQYANVFQLVSTVTARLTDGTTVADLLRSTFPAGSMTGAPKNSAMRLLHGLEGGPRGAYAGAFGYVSLNGTVELAMTIRSIVLSNGTASIGSGGGITALSKIDDEVAETFVKIVPLLAALGTRIGGEAS